MKWFQHDTKALSDAKIEKLIMKHGIEGYGLYFACIEIIAGNLSGKNITFELEHDAEILAHKFRMDSRKVEDIMKSLVTLGLFEMNVANGRVSCLKLLQRLDESTSKNPEIRRILNNSENFRKIPDSPSRLDYTRLEEISSSDDKQTTSSENKENNTTPTIWNKESIDVAVSGNERPTSPIDAYNFMSMAYQNRTCLPPTVNESKRAIDFFNRAPILPRYKMIANSLALKDYVFSFAINLLGEELAKSQKKVKKDE